MALAALLATTPAVRLMLFALAALRPLRLIEQRFVAHEFVAVLLQDRTGEGPSADHKNDLVVLFELVDQGDEVAVATDNGESVDMVVRERHLQRVQREVDIGAVL